MLLSYPSSLLEGLKDPAADVMRSSSELNWKRYDKKKRERERERAREKEAEKEEFEGEWEREFAEEGEEEDELERRVGDFLREVTASDGEAYAAKAIKLLREVRHFLVLFTLD